MASVGPTYCGTGAEDASVGTIAWANPTRITSSGGGQFALAQPSVQNEITRYLKGTNFGFAVPTTATIDGIVLEIENLAGTSNAIRDSEVKIVKGGTIGSTNKASATAWNSSAFAFVSYGSSTDLWGETWTPSDINASNFGAVMCATKFDSGGARNANVDSFRITVYYSFPSSGTKIIQARSKRPANSPIPTGLSL